MNQTIKGYYDPVAGVPGQITVIAGSGRADQPEYLVAPGILEYNPFQSLQGASWDNVTRTTASPAGPSFTTQVHTQGLGTHDCLTFGAIVYRTRVNDNDGDGILNVVESSTTPILDPNGDPLPNLSGIANPNRKDMFVEMGYFETTSALTYNGVSKLQHTHRPTHEALKKVGDAFAAAPVTNPDSSTGISVHFDLGNNFPAGVADAYIVRGALARGGESINETSTVCTRRSDGPTLGVSVPGSRHRGLEERLPVHQGQSGDSLRRRLRRGGARWRSHNQLRETVRSQPQGHLPLRPVRACPWHAQRRLSR